jgi:hypothetical protein
MYLSRLLKVDTSIEKIDVSLSHLSLKNFEIKNPAGSHLPLAFSCPSTEIRFTLSRLWKNPCVIDQVVLDHPAVSIEFFSDGSYNWGKMVDHLKGDSKEEKSETEKSDKVYTLSYFRCEKADIQEYNPIKSDQITRFKPLDLELKNISSDLSGPKLIAFTMQNFMLNIAKESHVEDLLKQAKTFSKDLLDTLIAPLKKSAKAEEEP